MAYLLTEKAADSYHSQEYRIQSEVLKETKESELEGKVNSSISSTSKDYIPN